MNAPRVALDDRFRRRRSHLVGASLAAAILVSACGGSGSQEGSDATPNSDVAAAQEVSSADSAPAAVVESTTTSTTTTTTIAPTTTTAPVTTIAPATTTAAPATTAATVTTPVAPTGGQVAFESRDGLTVGTDVVPGIYVAEAGPRFCLWTRHGSDPTVLDDGITMGRVIVEILTTDVLFDADPDCGTWTPFTPSDAPATTIGEGHSAVGTQIAPGTYTTDESAFDFCYWERSTGFTHSNDEIIENAIESSTATVTIEPTDARFTSSGCGTWTLVS